MINGMTGHQLINPANVNLDLLMFSGRSPVR